nr:thioredoxin domain-containing protein [Baia soyae]
MRKFYLDQPVLGNKEVAVTILEVGDFKCPSCRGFKEDIFPQLKKDYIETGKVKMDLLIFSS